VRRVEFTMGQPAPFSHQRHVAGLGIDCRFCQNAVEVGTDAALPSTCICPATNMFRARLPSRFVPRTLSRRALRNDMA